jgi:hypothetical protein
METRPKSDRTTRRAALVLACALACACDKGATGTGASPSASVGVGPSASVGVGPSASVGVGVGVGPSASVGVAPSASAAADTKPPDSIAAQHVLVAYKGAKNAPKGITRTKADAKKRAEEVRDKARAGEDFSKLVETYSDDPGAKERMGSLGKITRDKVVKEFADAAFALGVDKVSDIVETPFGFHVIKRNQ